jgi:choloylglycine hydrolase
MPGLDFSDGAPTLAVDPYDDSLAGDVTDRFSAHDIGF